MVLLLVTRGARNECPLTFNNSICSTTPTSGVFQSGVEKVVGINMSSGFLVPPPLFTWRTRGPHRLVNHIPNV